MSKNFTLAIFSSLLFFTAFGQRAHISWGEEGKKMIQNGYFYVKGKGTDIIQYNFITGKHGVHLAFIPNLVRLDKKMQVVLEKPLPELPLYTAFGTIANIDGRLLMFTKTYSKEDQHTSFYYQAINMETLELLGDKVLMEKYKVPTSIFEIASSGQSGYTIIDQVHGSSAGSSDVSGNFIFSEDSSKIMVFATAGAEKNQNSKFYFTVYDRSMNKIWQKEITLPYQSEFTSFLGSFVTNDGRVCVVVKNYDKGSKKEEIKEAGKSAAAYKTKMLVYENSNAAAFEYTINPGDRFLHSLEVSADNNGKFHLFGLCQVNPDGNINGYFTAEADSKEKAEPIIHYTDFTSTLVDLVKLDKQVNKRDDAPGISSSFVLKKVLKQDDGTKHYLLEFYENSSSTTSSLNSPTGMSSTTNWFVFGDIIDIIVAADKSSKVMRLPKNQISAQVSGASSFQATVYNDKPVFFYNDNDGNLKLNVNEAAPKSGMGSIGNKVLMMTVPDDKGGFKRTIIYDNSGNGFSPNISAGIWIDKNKLAFSAYSALLVMANKAMPGVMEIK